MAPRLGQADIVVEVVGGEKTRRLNRRFVLYEALQLFLSTTGGLGSSH